MVGLGRRVVSGLACTLFTHSSAISKKCSGPDKHPLCAEVAERRGAPVSLTVRPSEKTNVMAIS